MHATHPVAPIPCQRPQLTLATTPASPVSIPIRTPCSYYTLTLRTHKQIYKDPTKNCCSFEEQSHEFLLRFIRHVIAFDCFGGSRVRNELHEEQDRGAENEYMDDDVRFEDARVAVVGWRSERERHGRDRGHGDLELLKATRLSVV